MVAGVMNISPHRSGISRDSAASQPVARLVADPADLAAQHGVLVPEDQEFGVLGQLAPGRHRQAAEQAAYKQV